MTPSASQLRALFLQHIRAFNHGVRSGDFARMLQMYHREASFHLADPVSITHQGLNAIRRAYQRDPPKGTITVAEPTIIGRIVTAAYIWDTEPDRIAGQLTLQFDGDRILRKLVTYTPD